MHFSFPMHFSFLRASQWLGVAAGLFLLVGLNYDFDSKAGMRMNASLDDPLSQGLRGYWKLDEGTGTSTTADASGNANTLSMTGPPTWTTGTIGPYAMDFSGSGQYLSVASPASGVLDFAAGASFSITGWFNRDTFTADHTIVAKRNGQTATDDGYIVYIDDATDTLVFEASDTADTDEYQRVSSSAFTATGWHQFAVTWNDSATTDPVNIFIDGATNNGTATGTFANMGSLVESVAFRIGAESDNGLPFDGKLDDIRVYGSALSASEVARLYQTTAPAQPVDTGLVGHWTFDGPDVAGTTAMDRSGKGNNGTITGTTKTIGKLGQGLSFDGSDDVIDAGDMNNALDGVSQFTVSVWVKQDQILTSSNRAAVAKYNNGEEHFRLTTRDNQDTLCDGIAFEIAYVIGVYTDGPSRVHKAGVWEHWVGVFDGTLTGDVYWTNRAKIYLNGVEQLTSVQGPIPATTLSSTQPVAVGAYSYSGSYAWYWNGSLDDARIYNRALSANEVYQLYTTGR